LGPTLKELETYGMEVFWFFYADVLVIKKLNMSIIIFIDYFNSKKIYIYP